MSEGISIPTFEYDKCSNFIENDSFITQDIKKNEIVNSPFLNKIVKHGFFENTLYIVDRIQKEELNLKTTERQKTSTKGHFDEKVVWKTSLGGSEHEELDIDTAGTNLFAPKPSTSNLPKQIPQEKEKKRNGKKKTKIKQVDPIIIVPSSITSLLSLHNAKSLLENEKFETTEVAKKSNSKKERSIIIKRKIRENSQSFCIIDDPTRLSSNDWERVVAIFTTGQSWQFKGWPIQNPTELFSKCFKNSSNFLRQRILFVLR
jgi:hypothetical protein